MRPGLVGPCLLPGPGRLGIPAGRGRRRRLSVTWQRPTTASSFEMPTVPAPDGERGDESVLVLLVIDESPSEQAVDPQGYRHVAARRMVELLRTELKHKGDRVACVHFSTEPRPWLSQTNPHTKIGRQALRQMLRPVGGAAGTDIRAALRRAADLVPRAWDGLVLVVLLSDGQDRSTAEQLASRVERFPVGSVHVISIGSQLPSTWNDVPLGSTSVIPSLARPDEVEWAATQALYGALGVGWARPTQPPSSSTQGRKP